MTETMISKRLPLYGKGSEGKFILVDGDYDGEYFAQWHWRIFPNGYVFRTEHGDRKVIYLHREVGRPPNGMWAYHKNGNKLDNTSINIGYRTPSEQALGRLQGKPRRDFYRGVQPYSVNRFSAKGNNQYLGYFDTAEDAARAYDAWAKATFGDRATLNFPEEK